MIKRLLLILSLVFLVSFSLNAQDVKQPAVALIPYPVTLAEGEGAFVFTEKTVVALEDKEMETIAKDFIHLFTKVEGFTPKLKVNSKKGEVRLVKDDSLQEEGYVLEVTSEKILMRAASVKGAFYALQTLRQLLPSAIEGNEQRTDVVWEVPAVRVTDEPRFGYRGLMVDVARHFIAKEHLLRIIDTMGMLKLNKLHLHLTDDTGWRLEIKRYPLLTSVGSKTVKRDGLTFPERRNARQGEVLVDGGY